MALRGCAVLASRADPDLPVLRDDRHARGAYDRRGRAASMARAGCAERPVYRPVVYADRHDRSVLALRRYCLDFSVSVVIPDRAHARNVDMHEHVTPVKTYVGIFAALLALTLTTVLVSFVELGALNIIVALLIAFTKATLVVFIFMHVKWQNALTKLFVFSALAWLLLLIGITMSDYWSRPWLPRGSWM